MVGGTVIVEKINGQLKVEVNAVNSYDVPIHIVYDGTTTDLSNTQIPIADTKKVLRDGQLVIIRNGKAYTSIGVQVK